MINKIVFFDRDDNRTIGQLLAGNCFIYNQATTDAVYMKIAGPRNQIGCVSLKNGIYYDVDPGKIVRLVCIEILVSKAVDDCG